MKTFIFHGFGVQGYEVYQLDLVFISPPNKRGLYMLNIFFLLLFFSLGQDGHHDREGKFNHHFAEPQISYQGLPKDMGPPLW